MIPIHSELIKEPKEIGELLESLEDLIWKGLHLSGDSNFSKTQIQKAIGFAKKELLPFYLAQGGMVYLLKYPLVSKTASGKWGEFIFVTRNGKSYLKRYRIPKDPKTLSQLEQRNYFRLAVHAYQNENPSVKEIWKTKAENLTGLSGYNLYLREKIRELRNP